MESPRPSARPARAVASAPPTLRYNAPSPSARLFGGVHNNPHVHRPVPVRAASTPPLRGGNVVVPPSKLAMRSGRAPVDTLVRDARARQHALAARERAVEPPMDAPHPSTWAGGPSVNAPGTQANAP